MSQDCDSHQKYVLYKGSPWVTFRKILLHCISYFIKYNATGNVWKPLLERMKIMLWFQICMQQQGVSLTLSSFL